MKWTRRDWMLAMGALPLELSSLRTLDAQARREGAAQQAIDDPKLEGLYYFQGRDHGPIPPAPAMPAPVLPDKASFPHLRGTFINGSSWGPRPIGAIELIKRAALGEAGQGEKFRASETRIRQNFATLINADPAEVLFVPSTMIGESFVASALGVHEPGSHVVSDYLHFVGSQQMYTDMKKRGVQVSWVKIKDGRIPLDDLDRAIVKGKTKLVAVSATAMVNGFQHDMKRLCEIAHAKGAMVYADIIQQAGNSPIDVKAWGVDAACAATYKWLMSSGTALLYVRKESQAKMLPPFYHPTNYVSLLPTTHMYPFDKPGPDIVSGYRTQDSIFGMFCLNYEPNDMALIGLEYSLPYILNHGVDRIQAHAQTLVRRLKDELPRRGYPLLTPAESKAPIVSAVVENAGRLAPTFRAANVNVETRWNHIRISPSVFNDMEDIERFLAALPGA